MPNFDTSTSSCATFRSDSFSSSFPTSPTSPSPKSSISSNRSTSCSSLSSPSLDSIPLHELKMSADVHPTPFFHDKNHQTSLSIDTIQDFNTSPRSHSTPRRSAPHSPTQSHSLPSPTESSPSTPLRSEQMEHNESTESTENSDSSETTDSTESTNENQDEEPKAKVIYHCTICGRDRHLARFCRYAPSFLDSSFSFNPTSSSEYMPIGTLLSPEITGTRPFYETHPYAMYRHMPKVCGLYDSDIVNGVPVDEYLMDNETKALVESICLLCNIPSGVIPLPSYNTSLGVMYTYVYVLKSSNYGRKILNMDDGTFEPETGIYKISQAIARVFGVVTAYDPTNPATAYLEYNIARKAIERVKRELEYEDGIDVEDAQQNASDVSDSSENQDANDNQDSQVAVLETNDLKKPQPPLDSNDIQSVIIPKTKDNQSSNAAEEGLRILSSKLSQSNADDIPTPETETSSEPDSANISNRSSPSTNNINLNTLTKLNSLNGSPMLAPPPFSYIYSFQNSQATQYPFQPFYMCPPTPTLSPLNGKIRHHNRNNGHLNANRQHYKARYNSYSKGQNYGFTYHYSPNHNQYRYNKYKNGYRSYSTPSNLHSTPNNLNSGSDSGTSSSFYDQSYSNGNSGSKTPFHLQLNNGGLFTSGVDDDDAEEFKGFGDYNSVQFDSPLKNKSHRPNFGSHHDEPLITSPDFDHEDDLENCSTGHSDEKVHDHEADADDDGDFMDDIEVIVPDTRRQTQLKEALEKEKEESDKSSQRSHSMSSSAPSTSGEAIDSEEVLHSSDVTSSFISNQGLGISLHAIPIEIPEPETVAVDEPVEKEKSPAQKQQGKKKSEDRRKRSESQSSRRNINKKALPTTNSTSASLATPAAADPTTTLAEQEIPLSESTTISSISVDTTPTNNAPGNTKSKSRSSRNRNRGRQSDKSEKLTEKSDKLIEILDDASSFIIVEKELKDSDDQVPKASNEGDSKYANKTDTNNDWSIEEYPSVLLDTPLAFDSATANLNNESKSATNSSTSNNRRRRSKKSSDKPAIESLSSESTITKAEPQPTSNTTRTRRRRRNGSSNQSDKGSFSNAPTTESLVTTSPTPESREELSPTIKKGSSPQSSLTTDIHNVDSSGTGTGVINGRPRSAPIEGSCCSTHSINQDHLSNGDDSLERDDIDDDGFVKVGFPKGRPILPPVQKKGVVAQPKTSTSKTKKATQGVVAQEIPAPALEPLQSPNPAQVLVSNGKEMGVVADKDDGWITVGVVAHKEKETISLDSSNSNSDPVSSPSLMTKIGSELSFTFDIENEGEEVKEEDEQTGSQSELSESSESLETHELTESNEPVVITRRKRSKVTKYKPNNTNMDTAISSPNNPPSFSVSSLQQFLTYHFTILVTFIWLRVSPYLFVESPDNELTQRLPTVSELRTVSRWFVRIKVKSVRAQVHTFRTQTLQKIQQQMTVANASHYSRVYTQSFLSFLRTSLIATAKFIASFFVFETETWIFLGVIVGVISVMACIVVGMQMELEKMHHNH